MTGAFEERTSQAIAVAADRIRAIRPDDAPSYRLRRELQAEQTRLSKASATVHGQRQILRRLDDRLQALEERRDHLQAIEKELQAELEALDPKSVRDPHKQDLAWRQVGYLEASIEAVRLGVDLMGRLGLPEPLRKALVARGVSEQPWSSVAALEEQAADHRRRREEVERRILSALEVIESAA